MLTSSGAIGQLNQGRLDQLLAFGVPAETAAQLSINGVTWPMEDQWVLTPTEQASVAVSMAKIFIFYSSSILARKDSTSSRLRVLRIFGKLPIKVFA